MRFVTPSTVLPVSPGLTGYATCFPAASNSVKAANVRGGAACAAEGTAKVEAANAATTPAAYVHFVKVLLPVDLSAATPYLSRFRRGCPEGSGWIEEHPRARAEVGHPVDRVDFTEGNARRVVERLATALEQSLLERYATEEVAHAFMTRSGRAHGTIAPDLALGAIIDRHSAS